MNKKVLQPANWPPPRGYSNGIAAQGTPVYIAGQIGWNERGEFTSSSLADQVGQALRNIVAVLQEAGGKPEDIVRLTWFITDKREYASELKAIGAAYRAALGNHYPTMSVVQVTALIEDAAKVEIEATAVVPGNILA